MSRGARYPVMYEVVELATAVAIREAKARGIERPIIVVAVADGERDMTLPPMCALRYRGSQDGVAMYAMYALVTWWRLRAKVKTLDRLIELLEAAYPAWCSRIDKMTIEDRVPQS